MERTYDRDMITDIMTVPAIWDTVAEDDQDPADFVADTDKECWLRITNQNDEIIGVFNLHPMNSATLEIHAQVLPEHRREHSQDAGRAVLGWIYENAPEYKKLVAWVPDFYVNVLKYVSGFGFVIEGCNRKSYLKNGELHDLMLLGITREEIHEQGS